jgi:glycosyltransferase XagB
MGTPDPPACLMVPASKRSPLGPLAFVMLVAAAVATAAAGAAAATIFVVASIKSPSFLNVLYVVLSLLLGGVGWLILIWTLPLWREEDAASEEDGADRLFGHYIDPARGFSITLPAPRDEEKLEATLARLADKGYRRADVRLVAGDDARSREVAKRAAERHPGVVNVVVDIGLFELMSGQREAAGPDGRGRASRAATWVASALARQETRRALVSLLALALAAASVVASVNTASFLYVLYMAVSLLLGTIALTTLIWMLHAWRTPAALTESRLMRENREPAHSFSLIVPARDEEAVLETTLTRLVNTNHPAVEVLVVVGDDDPATREVAERVAHRHPGTVSVVVDDSFPKSKPKALNTALPRCTGDITGVFDAEDDVHPALLERVDQCFQKTGADIVQAGVQLMNFRSSWFTIRNVLEYYFWFRSRLHLHARQGFIPLGGNTVFVRTSLLRAVSGWDPDCLAEDCELGVRLSSLGARTAVFYEPELVTREECPPTLSAFARQRTRWNQGYLQTLRKGCWRRLPLGQRALGVYILGMPYLLAISWLLIPIALTTAMVVKAPVPITLVSFMPALPMVSMLGVELAGIGDFCRAYGERPSARDYWRLILGMPIYQAVLVYAAARAVAREARGDRGWEKTEHHGLHLGAGAGEGVRRASADRGRRSRIPDRPVRALAAGGGGSIALEAPGLTRPHSSNGKAVLSGNGRLNGATGRLNGANGRLNGASSNGRGAIALPGIAPAGIGGNRVRPPVLRGMLRRAAAWRADLVPLSALLVGVAIVQGTNMLHWPAVLFDEGTYVANAWAVQNRGALAFYTYTYGHPPLAWLLISAWTWARDPVGHATYSLETARELMFLVSMVSSALVYTLARRLQMGRLFAVAAVILFALCPLGLYFHRGVLLDNPATAWALAAFVLALTPRRRLWAFGASGACFAFSVLSKETTLVLLPALTLAVFQNVDPRTRRYCLTLFGCFLSLLALCYPLYATLKGELLPGRGHVSLLGTGVDMLFLRKGTGSIFDYHSAAHGIVMFWLSLDPWLLGAALVLSPIALARRNTRAVAVAFLIQVAMVLRPGYLPAMYVIALLPFAALIVAGSAHAMWQVASGRYDGRDPPAHRWRWGTGRRPTAVLFKWVVAVGAGAALAASTAVALLVVAPRWARADRGATTVRLDRPQRAAERWLVTHVRHDQRLIVTDDFWLYLIEHGFDSQRVKGGFNSPTVVSYWPLDKDPAVRRYFPNGWREFDYIVSTQAMRVTAIYTPSTRRALAQSRLVERFGRGPVRIEVRAIAPADHNP